MHGTPSLSRIEPNRAKMCVSPVSQRFACIQQHWQDFAWAAEGSDPCRPLNLLKIYKTSAVCPLVCAAKRTSAQATRLQCAPFVPPISDKRARPFSTFPMISITGKLATIHRRSPPDCRNSRHALLDKGANLRLCHRRQEVLSWSAE